MSSPVMLLSSTDGRESSWAVRAFQIIHSEMLGLHVSMHDGSTVIGLVVTCLTHPDGHGAHIGVVGLYVGCKGGTKRRKKEIYQTKFSDIFEDSKRKWWYLLQVPTLEALRIWQEKK